MTFVPRFQHVNNSPNSLIIRLQDNVKKTCYLENSQISKSAFLGRFAKFICLFYQRQKLGRSVWGVPSDRRGESRLKQRLHRYDQ